MSINESWPATHRGLDRRSFIGMAAALPVAACATLPTGEETALSAIPMEAFTTVADNLVVPEGVAADRAGTVYVSNQESVCAVIDADGKLRHVGPHMAANGIALDGRGGLIVAIFGLLHDQPGPLQRLDLTSGALTTLADKVDGRTLVASNFPMLSRDGGIYCSHSRWSDLNNISSPIKEGFVYRVDPDGKTSVVASDIGGANGCCFDVNEQYLYVAQTAAGNILRLPRTVNGFGPAEVYGPQLGAVAEDGTVAKIRERIAAGDRDHGYPDGIAFDIQGNLWVTLPFANKIVAITPDKRIIEIVSDPAGALMDMPTNLAWGGPDLRDLFIVSRTKGNVIRARSPVPGLPLLHQI